MTLDSNDYLHSFKRTRNKKFDLDLISNFTLFGLRIAKNLSFKEFMGQNFVSRSLSLLTNA